MATLKFCASLLFCLLPLSLAAQRVADVETLEGQIKLNPARDPSQTLAPSLGEDLFLQDVVTTMAKAKTRIRFIDASIISLGENTRLRITKLLFNATQPREAEFSLEGGLALFEVSRAVLGSFYQVATTFGIFRAKGTVFSVESTPTQAILTVFEGEVEFVDLSGTITSVPAGQRLEVDASGVRGVPSSIPVGEEGKILTSITTSITPILPAVTQLAVVNQVLSLPVLAPVNNLLQAPLIKSLTPPKLLGAAGDLQRSLLQPTLGLTLPTILSLDNTAGVTQILVTTGAP
jgi:hypothetical protein